ncbi:hypothetical protein LSH36_1616g00001 [Paralvinella palmiformis]|uniref:Uncharacterized protein n=1 Tax=Paralvinella palmiformis TaxID=53620 RepID=A0AAD9ISK6_9ANNE|nr:hypothetical protein LSH36_1616g00001 [Paralvinella palmiformis]
MSLVPPQCTVRSVNQVRLTTFFPFSVFMSTRSPGCRS